MINQKHDEEISIEDVRQRHIDLELLQETLFDDIKQIRKEMADLFDCYWDMVHQ